MTIGSVVLAGLLAMAPNWAVVDIPYPDAVGSGEAQTPANAETQVWDALASYARSKSVAPLRRSDIVVTRIDGNKAAARVSRGGKSEVIYLEYTAGEWKILKIE